MRSRLLCVARQRRRDAGNPLRTGPGGGPSQCGKAARHDIRRRRFQCASRAWDLLSIALSVVTADFAALRRQSPDGWTREIELDIAVADAPFWTGQTGMLAKALAFLTTDRWTLRFHEGGMQMAPPRNPVRPQEDCVVLLSGGLDSLVGAIDLADAGHRCFAISQTVRGDAEKQVDFAARIGGGLGHLQLNHNAKSPGVKESSQRVRSLIFIAFGVLAATALQRYHDGDQVPLYVCENGFIAINPPLTGSRLGGLSTRTAHPEFLGRLQTVLDAADLGAEIVNPYGAKTKGEMLRECANQPLLKAEAVRSTSCGRFQRFNYRQCGRCVPCQVRRAAFLVLGGIPDTTTYVYEQLGVMMKTIRASTTFALLPSRSRPPRMMVSNHGSVTRWHRRWSAIARALISMLDRGLVELRTLHNAYGVT